MFAISASRGLTLATLAASLALTATTDVAAQVSSSEPVHESVSAAPDLLDPQPEGTWDVIAYDPWAEGLIQPADGTSLTVSLLTGGRLEGLTGCGNYVGGYFVDGERIGLGIISKGFEACDQALTEEAVAFSVALDEVASWRPGMSGLELLDDTGAVRVQLERPAFGDITGDWVVQRYTRAGGATTEPLTDAPITLAFTGDGSVAGSTGCRFIEGDYSRDGHNILIGPIETIGPACAGAERKPERNQERRLFRLFDAIVRWERDATGLTFTDAFGEPLMVLIAAEVQVPVASAEAQVPAVTPGLGTGSVASPMVPPSEGG